MNHIEFIRKQAKNFLKDWQTQSKTVKSDGFISYHYDWKFYDVGDLFSYYNLDDKDKQNICLGHAQHYIAQMVGFKKWEDLLHASQTQLELAEILLRRFKNVQELQAWNTALGLSKIAQYDYEAVLDFAKQYYKQNDSIKLNIYAPKLKEPTNYINFIKETFPDEATRNMFEFFIASILIHDDRARKAAFFLGKGATGKSAIIRILNLIFSNMIDYYLTCTSLNMSAWDDSYLNKWAVIGNHVEYKISGRFFEIFTSKPIINGKICTAKMIIQGNFMPKITGNKSHYDSVIVIPFEHQIKKENQIDIDELCKKITPEIPIIKKRYENLYSVLIEKLDGIIPESKLAKQRKEEYIKSTFNKY